MGDGDEEERCPNCGAELKTVVGHGIVEETGEEIDYEGIVCPNGCNLGMN